MICFLIYVNSFCMFNVMQLKLIILYFLSIIVNNSLQFSGNIRARCTKEANTMLGCFVIGRIF